MERTEAGTSHLKNSDSAGFIQLVAPELDSILTPMGYASLRSKAKFLGVGVATLHSAAKGDPVGERLIYACRSKLPAVAYERLFREVIQ